MLLNITRKDKGTSHHQIPMKILLVKDESDVPVAEFELFDGDEVRKNLPDGKYLLRVSARGRQLHSAQVDKAKVVKLALDELSDSQAAAKLGEGFAGAASVSEDASRSVNQKLRDRGIFISFIGIFLFLVGFSYLIDATERRQLDSGWWVAAALAPGGIIAFIGVIYFNMSGALDKRCKKCNSNNLRYTESAGVFKGTYSRQEMVFNVNNKKTEYTRVIKTDFEHVAVNTCQSCGDKETWTFIKTTNSD